MAVKRAPTLPFEAVFILADLFDAQGYGRYSDGVFGDRILPQVLFQNEVRQYSLLTQEALGRDAYPCVFSARHVVPEDFDAAFAALPDSYVPAALELLPEDLRRALANALATMFEGGGDLDVVLPEAVLVFLGDTVGALMDDDPVERDRRLLASLQNRIPEENARGLRTLST